MRVPRRPSSCVKVKFVTFFIFVKNKIHVSVGEKYLPSYMQHDLALKDATEQIIKEIKEAG